MELDFQWSQSPPVAAEVESAWKLYLAIMESLELLDQRVDRLKLEATDLERLALRDGVLEAGFSSFAPTLSADELTPLLAAIL